MPLDFSRYDTRHYVTVAVRDGYAAWARFYDGQMDGNLDLSLLERVTDVDWSTTRFAVDLACGTGRIGSWLAERVVSAIDGIDLTPEMLALDYNPLMRLEAVIFDMDGVVTRTAQLHVRAWRRLFDEYLDARRARGETHAPFDPVKDYLAWVDGKPRYDGIQSFLEARDIDIPFGRREDGNDVETTCGLGNRKDQYFEEILNAEGVRVFESTVERIAELRALGARTALGTSSRHGGRIMRMAGITDQFDVIADGNTIRERSLRGKPSPDLFLEAARELGVPPGRTAVVEDAVAGVEAGRRGGFARVIGVNRGDNHEALERAGADVVVEDLAELSAEDLLTPPDGGANLRGEAR